ncbi:MAG: 1,4-dihydroxy-2-naphthoate octaprenyltransferase [Bacteroidales bacterium]|nr:1,4-dihydroxy-2-naphthoate octaprenyltransferase [Bacteroidales bacterium]
MSTVKALINSMRLRTLPLSLAGIVCGGFLAMGNGGSVWSLLLVMVTGCALQVLSNLSNEMGDHLSGVDGEGREGPNYSMTDGGLTEKQMWRAINGMVVFCCLSGLAMVLVSGSPWWLLLLGAAAIWASTHYTLGKNPYGYRGLGDLFVFIFFGIVSVMGSFFVVAHRIDFEWLLILPAIGVGLLSVAVLNVNNIRDMESDRGKRVTVPLKIGARRARWYQTFLIIVGALCMLPLPVLPFFGFLFLLPVAGLVLHLMLVWQAEGRKLDPALPVLVISTFLLAFVYGLIFK